MLYSNKQIESYRQSKQASMECEAKVNDQHRKAGDQRSKTRLSPAKSAEIMSHEGEEWPAE